MYPYLLIIRRGVIFVIALLLTSLALAPISWGFLSNVFSPVGHIVGVAFLALAIASIFEQDTGQEDLVLQALFAAMLSTLVWIVIEVAQSFVPDHGTDMKDLIWDSFGCFFGFSLVIGERSVYHFVKRVTF